MALLFAADRVHHGYAEMGPLMAQGTWVVSDRYLLSSLAYQSLHLPLDWVKSINARALAATVTILLDLEVDLAFARMQSRQGQAERYERRDWLRKIRKSYLQFAHDPSAGAVIVMDADRPREDIAADIWRTIAPLLPPCI